jgi:hypothetical protein
MLRFLPSISRRHVPTLRLIPAILVVFAFYLGSILSAKQTGINGVTQKNPKTLGCSCHGTSPSTATKVTITLPGTATPGQILTGTISVNNPAESAGGTDIATRKGTLTPGPGLQKMGTELSHTSPKTFDGSKTASWTFTYTAPMTEGFDTVWANGNAVNLSGTEEGDAWNYAKPVSINVTSGSFVKPISFVQSLSLSLSPNPAHVFTRLHLDGDYEPNTNLNLYDASGRFVKNVGVINRGVREVTVNTSDLTNGTYFVRAQSAGAVAQTKLVVSH